MGSLNVFSARDVRQRSGELLRDAEPGRPAVVTVGRATPRFAAFCGDRFGGTDAD